ncbi:hypothetical protein PIB30_015187 [Stylosanthes scabra]|uniref:Uncharacterized protein n=1 Tax=Stylosanthes scabra TaxID=79078 RepID=A0ABU6U628_9FABA|nr:hypothetical protein [Stylosanthes scabra]
MGGGVEDTVTQKHQHLAEQRKEEKTETGPGRLTKWAVTGMAKQATRPTKARPNTVRAVRPAEGHVGGPARPLFSQQNYRITQTLTTIISSNSIPGVDDVAPANA